MPRAAGIMNAKTRVIAGIMMFIDFIVCAAWSFWGEEAMETLEVSQVRTAAITGIRNRPAI